MKGGKGSKGLPSPSQQRTPGPCYQDGATAQERSKQRRRSKKVKPLNDLKERWLSDVEKIQNLLYVTFSVFLPACLSGYSMYDQWVQ